MLRLYTKMKTFQNYLKEVNDPLWKRRARLPAERKVGIAGNAIHRLLGNAVENVNRESDWYWELIINSDPEQVDSTLQKNGWKAWQTSRPSSTQTDVHYSHPEYNGVSVIHWFGKNGHQIDIESLND